MPASNETLHYIHQMARTAGLRLREPDIEALTLWSGERVRKLAMLVLELAPRLEGWQVLILGTDISGEPAHHRQICPGARR